MGYSIAEELSARGADVILISGPSSQRIEDSTITVVDVVSADDMYSAVHSYFESCDGAVMAAAVADYRPKELSSKKLKRSGDDYTLELVPNRDIAASLGAIKRPDQVLVGFALETNDEVNNAVGKLNRKNLDFIVLNSMNDKGAGFQCDTNKISIIDKLGNCVNFDLKDKCEVAKDIANALEESIGLVDIG